VRIGRRASYEFKTVKLKERVYEEVVRITRRVRDDKVATGFVMRAVGGRMGCVGCGASGKGQWQSGV
jgi:hypothetical protein